MVHSWLQSRTYSKIDVYATVLHMPKLTTVKLKDLISPAYVLKFQFAWLFSYKCGEICVKTLVHEIRPVLVN